MNDLLALQRLNENLIDQVKGMERRLARLERVTAAVDDNGRMRLPGVLIREGDTVPARPPAGHVLIYAVEEGLRAMNDQGAVRDLARWKETGLDVRVRHVGRDEWWRLYMDVGAAGKDQFFYEPEEGV